MTGRQAPEPTWQDVCAWFETIDALIRGLGHSLNNRALALSATIESLDPRRPLGGEVTTALSRETERLSEQLRQLRALPFDVASEPMPLLIRDVLASAIQLHRAHASLGQVPVYLEGTAEAPPVLAPESSLVHAVLVLLTALKAYAAPNGVVRVHFDGTAEELMVRFEALRDPRDPHEGSGGAVLVRPTALAAGLLRGAGLEMEQQLGPEVTRVVWALPSLQVMRRRGREAAAAG